MPLTKTQKITRLAKVDGWTQAIPLNICRWENLSKSGHNSYTFEQLPDYLTNGDVMRELIGKQHPTALADISTNLLEQMKIHWLKFDKDIDWSNGTMIVMATLQATPEQLSDALLSALGLDGEEV